MERKPTDIEILESIVQDTYNSGRAGSTSIDGIVSALFICGPGDVGAKLARLFAVYIPIDCLEDEDDCCLVDMPVLVDVKKSLLPISCVSDILKLVLNAARTVACSTLDFPKEETELLLNECQRRAENDKISLGVWVETAMKCPCLMQVLDYENRK